MHEAAADLFQLLVQAGAVPGEDFSCDPEEQAYRLNERCYDLLQAAYPEVDWLEILGVPYVEVQARIAALHRRLGYPFVDDLVALMAARMAELPEAQAAGYLQVLLAGVEAATGIALYPFLAAQLDLAGQMRLEWLLRQPAGEVPEEACLWDLLQAAGSTEADYQRHQGEIWLTEAGKQRLSAVWHGAKVLPVGVSTGP